MSTKKKTKPKKSAFAKDAPPLAASTGAITEALRSAGQPLTFEELAASLGATAKPAKHELTRELEALLHAGEIVRNRREEYCLRERLSLIVGTISAHRDGHGFLLPDDRTTPVFLAPRQMKEVIHGDRAAVRVTGTDSRGRPEGTLVEVLERDTQRDRRPPV